MAEKADSSLEKTNKLNLCTPTSDSRRRPRTLLRQPFKSPVLNTAKTANGSDTNSSESEVDELKKKIQEIDNKIEEMGIEYSEDELQLHIEKLHEYNEIKDVGQLLLGKIAEIEGKTTKMLYEEYGLEIED